jgi:hypothetical protein
MWNKQRKCFVSTVYSPSAVYDVCRVPYKLSCLWKTYSTKNQNISCVNNDTFVILITNGTKQNVFVYVKHSGCYLGLINLVIVYNVKSFIENSLKFRPISALGPHLFLVRCPTGSLTGLSGMLYIFFHKQYLHFLCK